MPRMAKSRRVTKSRTSARKPARTVKKRAQAERRRPERSSAARGSSARTAAKPGKPGKSPSASKVVKASGRAAKPAPVAPPLPAPPPPRKPTYHEAVAMYERGLQALQRRDFSASADALRTVIERYPDERELLERARLYLKVCERELEPKEPAPKTADEWVYAATVALNQGDEANALLHLQRAISADSRHDHAHYMMAVASARRGDINGAMDHLRRAVSLNPENRSIARQDPELDSLRVSASFRAALDTPPAEGAGPRSTAAVRMPRPKPRR
jgi:tetratricopeptide (TPR) repeat protein